jgi:hypothetical protein
VRGRFENACGGWDRLDGEVEEGEGLTLMKTWESSSLSYVSLLTVFLLLYPTYEKFPISTKNQQHTTALTSKSTFPAQSPFCD